MSGQGRGHQVEPVAVALDRRGFALVQVAAREADLARCLVEGEASLARVLEAEVAVFAVRRHGKGAARREFIGTGRRLERRGYASILAVRERRGMGRSGEGAGQQDGQEFHDVLLHADSSAQYRLPWQAVLKNRKLVA
jgi:hypothetical protein